MKRIFLRLKQPLRNERGEITFFACFFVVGIVMLISFLLLYASIRITCINIRNGAKMELNNLSGTIYADTTGRRVSFEYSMVRGVNDSDACARQLANLIRGMGAHVNLIPINPVDGSPYSATDAANVHRFQQKLESLGVNATVRRRLGSEISAACGQLRRDEMNGKA